jgi:hypothetical protein
VPTDLDIAQLRSIQDINARPPAVRDSLYAELVPDEVLARVGIARETLAGPHGEPLFRVTAPPGESWARIEVRASHEDRDPLLLVDVEMSPLSIPELAFVQITDPTAPRYDIDRDLNGQDTLFGTASRNLAEEERAMRAGLAPGQVRRGLRLFGRVIESMDRFCRALRQDLYLIEPLFYHSAILYERFGCGYLIGREQMEEIHRAFAPDGALTGRLDGSTPFRQAGLERTVRGRSWAIADGILGGPFAGIKMYRSPGRSANICTFPDGQY